MLGDTAERIAGSSRWEYDDLPYWGGEVDCRINGCTLANGTWLGADVSGIVTWFADHQMADGGWNCAWEWDPPSSRGSFHSTLNTLEGLLYREKHGAGRDETAQLQEMRRAGQEYLLERSLLRRRTTGDLVGPWVDQFAYPFRRRFSALHAVDCVQCGDQARRDHREERGVDRTA